MPELQKKKRLDRLSIKSYFKEFGKTFANYQLFLIRYDWKESLS